MNARLRRVATTVAVVIAVFLLAGATYQGLATAFERRDFPPPGQRIDVGGHQLHIYCTGEGRPAVVLEAPATGMSAAWGWVQPEIARRTRVCSYDRAGLGWSEAGDGGYDPRHVPTELHTLLAAARVTAPYILVGESLGATFVRMYVARYAGEVGGVVLVDDVTPAVRAEDAARRETFARFVKYAPWLARAGVLRATRLLSSGAKGLPEPAGGAVGSFLNRPDHLTRSGRELARWDETLRLASETPLPQGLPVAEVRTGSVEPGALITTPAVAANVTNAIVAMVEARR